MKHLWMLNLVFIMAVGCGALPESSTDGGAPVFLPAAAELDQNLDAASIEDYVVTLPVEYEGQEGDFVAKVRGARRNLVENRNAGPDYLHIGGDGSRGLISFRLDREKRMLQVFDKNWEDESLPVRTYYLYRVPGGWVRSDGAVSPVVLRSPRKLREIRYWDGYGG